MIEITIIIPVYNEIKTINKLLEKVINLEIKKQIIVIDDASIDGTKEYLLANQDKLDKLICHEKNLGKGACIQSAQIYITGVYTGIQDADLEYNPNDLKKIIEFMKKNNSDVVYGSRVLGKNKYENTENHIVLCLV